MCLGMTAGLVLVGPLLVLAAAVLGLWAHGPLGAVAAVLLVLGLLVGLRLAVLQGRRWWASTPGRWQE